MGILSSISNITGSDKKHAKAFLVELDDDGDQKASSFNNFQYFPETISDSRGVNYTTKEVIGGSHPIYQWIHGSERTISFDAIFTADFTVKEDLSQFLSAAASVLKNPVSAVVSAFKGPDPHAPEIKKYIAWLRSKTYPAYEGTGPVSPPPKMLLWLEGSGITSGVGGYASDVIPVIMKRCDVTYEAFFRDGSPRIATVALEFAEIIQIGSAWEFVNRSDIETSWSGLQNTSDKTEVGAPTGESGLFGF